MAKDHEAEFQEYKLRADTIVLAGMARLPEKIRPKDSVGYLTIYLEIDPINSKIVDFTSTITPFLGEKILYEALLGQEVEKGIHFAIQQLEERFFAVTKRAAIAALEDAYKWYKKYLEENK